MSDILVQKFGGSSVADADKIRKVAERVSQAAETSDVVVVVSAMGSATDDLIDLAAQIDPEPQERELDLLLSTGEVISSTLLSMALRHRGVRAISLTGGQAGIQTDRSHRRARITKIDPRRLKKELERGYVVIVAGFQGTTEDLDVTTLGRGGSDTTAVALAVALGAERAEIYTDVAGIYTADPRLVSTARRLDEIHYEEMLEMASWGARVLNPRAVELGMAYGMPILAASSFGGEPGTLIHGEAKMEKSNKVRGIVHDYDVAKITVLGAPDRPGIAVRLFEPLAEDGISVDVIVQNTSVERSADMSFTVSQNDLVRAERAVREIARELGAQGVETTIELAKVSIVGAGMQSSPGFAARMFRALYEADVNIEMITTSEIRITCLVEASQIPKAVEALHRAFELDRPE